MSFNYEQSIWGRGEADLGWFNPAAFRLRQALLAVEKLSTGAKALEVGSGAGQFIRAIERLRPELSCFGCDISAAAISEAQKRAGWVEYALSEPVRLPYGDKTFDAVLIFDVLEHAEDPRGLLAEIRRVLKSGGVFYCFAPCEGDWTSLWRWLDKIGLKNDLTKKYAGHVNYFSRRELFGIFKNNGFEVKYKRYSEHLFGQILGIAAFLLMNQKSKRSGGRQSNNEEFFAEANKKIGLGGRLFKNVVNLAVYLESVIFSRAPSPNVHIRAAAVKIEIPAGVYSDEYQGRNNR